MTGFPAPKPEQETLGPRGLQDALPQWPEGETSLVLGEDGRRGGARAHARGAPGGSGRRLKGGGAPWCLGSFLSPSDRGGWPLGGSVCCRGGWLGLSTPSGHPTMLKVDQTLQAGTTVTDASLLSTPARAGGSNDS